MVLIRVRYLNVFWLLTVIFFIVHTQNGASHYLQCWKVLFLYVGFPFKTKPLLFTVRCKLATYIFYHGAVVKQAYYVTHLLINAMISAPKNPQKDLSFATKLLTADFFNNQLLPTAAQCLTSQSVSMTIWARSRSLPSVNHDPAVFLTTARVTRIVLAVFTTVVVACITSTYSYYSIIDRRDFLDLFSNKPMQITLTKIIIEKC